MSYLVLRRTNQIGVRMAPGARGQDILAMVLREAGTLLAVGLGVGAAIGSESRDKPPLPVLREE
jgi:ABC-type antimicrobial peptide transport system permease subunit